MRRLAAFAIARARRVHRLRFGRALVHEPDVVEWRIRDEGRARSDSPRRRRRGRDRGRQSSTRHDRAVPRGVRGGDPRQTDPRRTRPTVVLLSDSSGVTSGRCGSRAFRRAGSCSFQGHACVDRTRGSRGAWVKSNAPMNEPAVPSWACLSRVVMKAIPQSSSTMRGIDACSVAFEST